MANHGYAYTKKELDFDDVVKNINKINHDIFGGHLDVEVFRKDPNKKYSDDSFCIKIPELGETDSISFWISDETSYGEYRESKDGDDKSMIDDNGFFEEYDESKIICKDSVLEFRHGGGSPVRWWLEGVFREGLAEIYECEVGDDGYDGTEPAQPQHYKTLDTYLSNSKWHKKDWELLKNERIVNNKSLEQCMKEFYKNVEIKKRERKIERILKNL